MERKQYQTYPQPKILYDQIVDSILGVHRDSPIESAKLALGVVLDKFTWVCTRRDLRDAETIQKDGWRIPVADGTLIGIPLIPILRTYAVQMAELAAKPFIAEAIPTATEVEGLEGNYMTSSDISKLAKLIRSNHDFTAHSALQLLIPHKPEWQLLTEEIAQKFSNHNIGKDDLENWDMAQEVTLGPVLGYPMHRINK